MADERISRDPDDDKFVSLALDAGATIIISGDRDLKEIRMHKGNEAPRRKRRGIQCPNSQMQNIHTARFASFLNTAPRR